MAKKRLDRKRDKSSGQRIAGTAKAALALTAGVALIGRTRFDQRILGDVGNAIGKTVKTYNDELLGKKRTATNIYNALNKSIGKDGKVFKETLEAQKNRKINISTSRTNNLGGIYKNINQTLRKGLYDALDETDKIFIRDQVVVESMYKELEEKYSKDNIRQIVDGVRSRYKVIKEGQSIEDEIDLRFLEKTIGAMGMSASDAQKIAKQTIASYDQNFLNDLRGLVYSQAEDLEKQIEKLAKDKAKQKAGDTFLNRIGKKFGVDNLEEWLLGSRAATVGDIKKAMQDGKLERTLDSYTTPIKNRRTGKFDKTNELDEIFKEEGIDDVVFDKKLRVKRVKGEDGEYHDEIFDMSSTIEFLDKVKRKWNSTLPGKVLTKGIDFESFKSAPQITFHLPGKRSLLSQFDDGEDSLTEKLRVQIGGTMFDIDQEDGIYKLGKELGEVHVFGMSHGTVPGILKRMLGSGRVEPLASRNPILEWLDINQDGRPNIIKRFMGYFTKFEDENWERNSIDRVIQEFNLRTRTMEVNGEQVKVQEGIEDIIARTMTELGINETEAINRIHEDHQLINDLFRRRASMESVSNDTVMQILREVTSTIDNAKAAGETISDSLIRTQELLQLIINGDVDETFNYLIKQGRASFETQSLYNLAQSYLKDSDKTLRHISSFRII